MELVFLIVLTLLVIILSALVSSSEVALLSISYPQVKEMLNDKKNKSLQIKAEKLLHIKENLKQYLTTIVVLNNIINIIGSIYIGVLAAEIFGELYLGIVSGVLTFLIIIFSEIIPKIMGERYAKVYAPMIAGPLVLSTKILSPALWVFDKIVHFFVGDSQYDTHVSEGIIREMAALGKQEGSIDPYESELIENVFEMNDIEVYEIMVPRKKVQCIEHDANFQRIIKLITRTGHTRFPVLKKGEVTGLIHAKDLFKYHGREKKFSVKEILRPIEFVPDAMKLATLEEKLVKNRVHMAAVVNEHGDFTGIVTLEHVFEELIGRDIEDEYDDETQPELKELKKNHYLIDASYDIEELDEKLDLELHLEDDFVTLNGFIIDTLGRIPSVGEKVKIRKGHFVIKKATSRQILQVELLIKNSK